MKSFAVFIVLVAAIPAFAADTVRICTYNLLNYSLSNEDGRTAKFKMIMDSIRPDILVCQEVVEGAAVSKFLADALGSAYFSPTFHDGPDSDNALFFKTAKFEVTNISYIPTGLRDIALYILRSRSTGAYIKIFSVHLKASDTDSDAVQRGEESQTLYNEFSAGIESDNIAVAGDFNFYSTAEAGYWTLAGIRALPTLTDPLGSAWKRNDANYASYYTQSPRLQASAACGGGTGGGMDDRFDYIFMSNPLHQKMLPGSYTHFGNDGIARLNSSIDSPTNTKYPAAIAEALRCASDHLPVYSDVVLYPSTGVHEEQQTAEGTIPRYYDILGREIKEPQKGGWYLKKTGSQTQVIIY